MFGWFRKRSTESPFQTALRNACSANGWVPERPNPFGAMLRIVYRAFEYRVGVFGSNGTVLVAGYSHGEFLPKRYPPAMRTALLARNRDLKGIEWMVRDDRAFSAAAVTVRFPEAELNAARLKAALDVIFPELARFDGELRRKRIL